MPRPSRAAQRRPSAPPFATHPSPRRMSSVSARTVPADELRVRAHRVGGPDATVERLEPRERVRHPLERQRVGHDAAAVDGGRHRHGLDLGSGCDLREHRLLDMDAPASRYPSVGQSFTRQSSSIAACFPEQLCSSRVGSGPHSRSSSLASAFVRRRCTGSSWSGRWRCDAQAIAISASSRSGRARTIGSAWIGFAELRKNVTSAGSPQAATTFPRSPRRRVRGAEPPRARLEGSRP